MEKRLITSALPYVNNVPHLGNVVGSVLSADIFARYCRSAGYKTLYVCGTDEYGTATETKALEEGVSPKEICDKYYKIHKEVYDWFEISFDIFGRTSTPKHTEITQQLFLQLYKNGYIIEEESEQPYDEENEMFLADRYVEGECPFCGYKEARGDQCDKCGKLLTFKELINPKSKLSGKKPVLKKTKHLYIELPKLQERLEEWMERRAKEGFWSDNALGIARSWLKEGLKKRSITRDLKWGVPVPLEGYKNKVFYVWFDAPIGYVSITANYTDDWEQWWKDKKVKLYQFMGKDNVPFHTIVFPATLIGAGGEWNLVYHVNSTEYLNYEGGKFSKSRGVGVFGNSAMESGIPADVWRYYLMINRPEQADSDFNWGDFAEKLNNELVANLGNLVNRTIAFTYNKLDGKIGEAEDVIYPDYGKITENLEKGKFKDALKEIMHVAKEGNKYFQGNEPWVLIKEDKEKAGKVLGTLVHVVKDLGILIEPFMPAASRKIFEQLNLEKKGWDDLGKKSIPAGHNVNKPEILFRKIEQKEVEELRKRFGGSAVSFSKLDLEVGEIISVERHPNAEKLYIEKVKLGDEERTIVSGLVEHYKEEELVGKKVIIVRNLKPAKLRGVVSEGMLLAAEKGKEVEVVFAEGEVGAKVLKEGEENKSAKEISIDDFFKVDFEVKDGNVYAEGKRIVCEGKEVKTYKVKDGKIS
ncbi:methionine--tRNA ligase [Candidatus Micrarchaeota archaeon]|nr:methionine--tRNA ligase [Candidatus Micrarchaeota archaeon]